MNSKRDLVFVGDIHGEFRKLVWEATTRYNLKNTDLFILGDFGVGFDNRLKYDYKRCEKKLEKHEIEIYTIRGNHDDPKFFTGEMEELKEEFPRIHFLQDHKIVNLGDISIYPIGGGASVDITDREPGISWWEGEYIEEKPIKELPGKVDIIVSHEAPLTFEPIIRRFSETPEEQYEKILKGRTYLSSVLKEVTCKNWFYGHYHSYYSGAFGDVLYRGLGIMEFYNYYKSAQ